MTAVGLLHGIHGKKPDAVGHVPQVLVAGLRDCLDDGGWGGVSHNWKVPVSRDRPKEEVWRSFAVTQTGDDLTRNVSADRAPIGARDSKPEDSDSFRLTGYRRSHYSLEFAPTPVSFAIRLPNEELPFLE
jgi:hypothetical protein